MVLLLNGFSAEKTGNEAGTGIPIEKYDFLGLDSGEPQSPTYG